MKKKILLSTCWLLSFAGIAQDQSRIVTEYAENAPYKATVDLDAQTQLFVGQEYVFNILANSDHDVVITSENLDVVFDNSSMSNTGALDYTVSPNAPGKCFITIGIREKDSKKSYQLIRRSFDAINYPIPPIHIAKTMSGEIIDSLETGTKISCKYPASSGINESYKITSWKAKLGNEIFEGEGQFLTDILIEAINKAPRDTILVIEILLAENKTGYASSKGVFILE